MRAAVDFWLRGAVVFTPGDRAERFDKGWAASSGQLILDLEDAVTPERKAAAREAVANWIAACGHQALVRVNSTDSIYFGQDCAVLGALPIAGLVVPKVNFASDLDTVRATWPTTALFPLIETAQGLESACEIAQAPGVSQLMLGALDLHADCGIQFSHPALLEHARLRLVLASRVGGIKAPVDSPHPAVHDLDEVSTDAQAAARLGFAGKLCIHPAQVTPVNDAFRPSEEQLAWAREVLAAAESGAGALQVRGRMVDAPVIASARAILGKRRANAS